MNAGMLMAYSFTYAKIEDRPQLYGMGYFAIIFYATHVVTIVIVSNFIFWLKDVDPRFRDGKAASDVWRCWINLTLTVLFPVLCRGGHELQRHPVAGPAQAATEGQGHGRGRQLPRE